MASRKVVDAVGLEYFVGCAAAPCAILGPGAHLRWLMRLLFGATVRPEQHPWAAVCASVELLVKPLAGMVVCVQLVVLQLQKCSYVPNAFDSDATLILF